MTSRSLVSPLFGAGHICAVLLLGACADPDTPRGVNYRPAAELPRIQVERVPGPDVSLVRDFDVLGEDLLLILELGDHVRILSRSDSAWRPTREVGRRGRGPGEFANVTGVARTRAGFMAASQDRLQFFTTAGDFDRFVPIQLPCAMVRPAVYESTSGIFLSGDCRRSGYTTDTVYSTLAWAADSARFEPIAIDLRFTHDGKAGSIFGPWQALSPGASGRHLFGVGSLNCIWQINDTGKRPGADQICPLVSQLYRADPPPGLEKSLARAPAGMTVNWPETLPLLMAHIATSLGDVLIRPYSADSVVLQLVRPGGGAADDAASVDLAVAPLNSLVGCKAGGCMWVIEDDVSSGIVLLDTARVKSLIRQRTGRSE